MSTPAEGAVHTVTYLEVDPSAAGEVAQFLKPWSQQTRSAAGITRFEVLQRTAFGHHFALVASWTSRAAYDAAREGTAGSGMRAQLSPRIISGIDTRIHTALIGGSDAARGKGHVHVVTHVDVPPPNKDACIELLLAQVAGSRKEGGCARFEVLQQGDRPNHFTVLESWAGQKDYEAHIAASATREFRHKLTPLSGALYDERLYGLLG